MKGNWVRNRPRHEVKPMRRWKFRLWLAVAGFLICALSKDEGWIAGAALIALAVALTLFSSGTDKGIRKI